MNACKMIQFLFFLYICYFHQTWRTTTCWKNCIKMCAMLMNESNKNLWRQKKNWKCSSKRKSRNFEFHWFHVWTGPSLVSVDMIWCELKGMRDVSFCIDLMQARPFFIRKSFVTAYLCYCCQINWNHGQRHH